MTTESEPVSAPIPPKFAKRRRSSEILAQFLQRDKTPVAILLVAALVGILAGLVGVAFEHAVNWVQNLRLSALESVAGPTVLLWPLAFIISALLAMF